jgi:AraC-like DNA-binding protein
VIAHAFAELDVSIALWSSDEWWHAIHRATNVLGFEWDRGVSQQRWSYNQRCLGRAVQGGRLVVGEHAGFRDLFVPVRTRAGVEAVVVTGPFALARPTRGDILRRWFGLTGSTGHLTDPAFSRYVSSTLATLTLEGKLLAPFERLVSAFAALLAGDGDLRAHAAEAERMRQELTGARYAERMFAMAHRLAHEQTGSVPLDHGDMAGLGLERVPQHVIVGLLLDERAKSDPLDDLLRHDAFVRACVTFARQRGAIVCGPVGDHGVVFVVDCAASRAKVTLSDLVRRMREIARRFRFELHAGIAEHGAESLALRYVAALRAAEKAISRGIAVVRGEPMPERSDERLRALRYELGKNVGRPAALLAPHFEQYVEAVLAHTGYRLENTRTHLQSGLECLVEPLRAAGILDARTSAELWASAERVSEGARTVAELVSSYRAIVTEMAGALGDPVAARHERATRRALRFVQDHLAEPLSLDAVARAAGFAPDHFSRLFKQKEKVTFAHYLSDLRLTRAKEMLRETNLTVEQVQRLCGFQSRVYFHHAFRKAVGATPAEYRRRSA